MPTSPTTATVPTTTPVTGESKWAHLFCEERSNHLSGAPVGGTTKTFTEKRNEFQRDYDRALFSSPVRRLQDKAQVFPLEPHDSVRTRLTHSLEVANIAQGLTNRALNALPDEYRPTEEQIEKLTSIAATCGLVHDLGNPPFGHAGEEAMMEWFSRILDANPGGIGGPIAPTLREELQVDGQDMSQDFLRFDGNPQTLRLLTRLTMLADYDGLSLTLGTLSAALKYIARSDQTHSGDNADHARTKPGFFFSEKELVKYIQEKVATGDRRNPITFLVEAADDIVYSTVDLEDGIKKNSLTWDELVAEFKDKGVAVDIEKDGKFEKTGIFKKVEDSLQKRLDYSKIKLSPSESDEARSQLFRTMMIGEHMEAVSSTFKEHIEGILAGTFTGELLDKGATKSVWKASKKIARARVFPAPSILRLELMGRGVIHDLMNLFWQGIARAPYPMDKQKGLHYKAYRLLSNNYRKVFEHAVEQDIAESTGIPVTYRRLQLVADYICGMTDTFAVTLHREMFNG